MSRGRFFLFEPHTDGYLVPSWRRYSFFMVMCWNMNGMDSMSTLAMRVQRPGRTFPLTISIIVPVVVALYVLVVLAATGVNTHLDMYYTGYFAHVAGQGGTCLTHGPIYTCSTCSLCSPTPIGLITFFLTRVQPHRVLACCALSRLWYRFLCRNLRQRNDVRLIHACWYVGFQDGPCAIQPPSEERDPHQRAAAATACDPHSAAIQFHCAVTQPCHSACSSHAAAVFIICLPPPQSPRSEPSFQSAFRLGWCVRGARIASHRFFAADFVCSLVCMARRNLFDVVWCRFRQNDQPVNLQVM